MLENLADILSKRTAQNIVSLFFGLGVFGVVFKFINDFTNTGGGFLGFLFFPAIFCGAAIADIKIIRKNTEEKNLKALIAVLLINILLFAAGILFLIEFCINYLHY